MSVNIYDKTTKQLTPIAGHSVSEGGGGNTTNFIGTLEEWEALTDAQKAQYDTYDFTNDYNGNGVDSALSSTSENPVQNKVVAIELNKKVNSSDLATVATSGSYSDLSDKPTIDDALSSSSTNAVQNKVVTDALANLGNNFQYNNMPTVNEDNLGEIVQYIGSTTNDYVKGYFYECVYEDEMYFWKPVEFMTGASIQYSEMPTPGPAWLDRIVQYTGTVAPYTNGFFYKCVYNSGDDEYNWVEWFVQPTTEPIHLVDVSGATIEREFKVATIYWTDPDNSVIDSQTVAQWAGTKLVRKVGSAPQHEFDGDLIINSTVRDAYAEEGFVDNTLEYDKVYYYRFFPYSTTNVVTKGTSIRVHCQRVQVPLPSQVGNLYYNKQTQEPTLTSEVGISKSGEINGKNAGDYEMTLSLISDDYQWSGSSFTDKTITWTIQKAQAIITPSNSNISLGRHGNTKKISFSDLYDRTITSVQSSDTDVCSVTTDGEEVSIAYAGLGAATVTVTTNSTDNSLQATATISIQCILQTIYGFQIDGDESDPSSMVNYLTDSDNYNYTPAYMNFSTGQFDYGSWREDEFFMPRPCMVRYDGTVAYYLDPDDYTKKANGDDSDVGDTTFQGNAMMEWGRDGYKIWYKVVPFNSAKSGKIYIANYQADANYHDWSFHNCDGVSADHFYTPIYNGSFVDGKLRSMSGQNILNKRSGTDEISYAKANNPSTQEMWNIECFADRQLINFLLILMGKSTNTQAVFGQGACNNGSESVNNTFTSGVHNAKGLFYGTNSGSVSSYNFDNCVKIFGMENYWGFMWRRTNGLMYVGNNQKAKFTYGQEDGSGVNGYNTNGDSYIDLGIGISGTNGGYISRMKFTDKGMFPEQVSGSDSTYYADGDWFSNGTQFSLFGGDSDYGGRVGTFCVLLNNPVSFTYWDSGACISCKPLKEEEE